MIDRSEIPLVQLKGVLVPREEAKIPNLNFNKYSFFQKANYYKLPPMAFK